MRAGNWYGLSGSGADSILQQLLASMPSQLEQIRQAGGAGPSSGAEAGPGGGHSVGHPGTGQDSSLFG